MRLNMQRKQGSLMKIRTWSKFVWGGEVVMDRQRKNGHTLIEGRIALDSETQVLLDELNKIKYII